MRVVWLGLLAIVALLAGCADAPTGAIVSGKYRNLFAEGWHSQRSVDAKVEQAFAQLFHGDATNEAIYFADGANANGPQAYILDVANEDVRTEGMSYGMMICVQLDKKAEFDALWNWARTHMYHDDPKHPAYGFFSWSVGKDGVAKDEMPACDGEEYFAMSLIFAAHRWGNGTGIYDYGAAADRLLRDMRHRAPITGMTVAGWRNGRAMFAEKPALVRFVPSENYTDPSYVLPAFYALWALWGPEEDRAYWAEAARAGREFFAAAADPKTGLMPDFAEFDGRVHKGSEFHYDAWRAAANVGVDWAWFAADVRERALCERLETFFWWKGTRGSGNHFTLAGKELSPVHSSGLVAMNAVTALAARNWGAQDFVGALWNLPVPTGKYRYYDGCLYMLGLLECSGKYRVWGERNEDIRK